MTVDGFNQILLLFITFFAVGGGGGGEGNTGNTGTGNEIVLKLPGAHGLFSLLFTFSYPESFFPLISAWSDGKCENTTILGQFSLKCRKVFGFTHYTTRLA